MKEKRQAYNSKCEATGLYYFAGEKLPEGFYPIVVMIAIENSKGEFLMQRRSKFKTSPLTWTVTGGHPTFDENNIQAVAREVKEELGLDISQDKIESFWLGWDGKVCREMFYCKKDLDLNKLILQVEEVDSVAWFSKSKILKMIKDKEFTQNQILFFSNFFEWKDKQL